MYFKYTILLCLFYFQVIQIASTGDNTKHQSDEELSRDKIFPEIQNKIDTLHSKSTLVVSENQEPLLIQLLALSVSVAREAGKIIRKITEENVNLDIVFKGDDGPQTVADTKAQSHILESFKNQFPNVNVIGEEPDTTPIIYSENLRKILEELNLVAELDSTILKLECPQEFRKIREDQITLWVDPLDGTLDFTKGKKENVTVLIGICVDDKAVAGVIHQPYVEEGRTLWGLVGYGVGGFKIQAPPTDKIVYVTSSNNSTQKLTTYLNLLKTPGIAYEIINVGGVGNKVVYLLDGKAEAYIHPTCKCNRWDTAAPEAVLRAAGGELTDRNGENYCYGIFNKTNSKNEYGIIATAPRLNRKEFMKKIKDANSKMEY